MFRNPGVCCVVLAQVGLQEAIMGQLFCLLLGNGVRAVEGYVAAIISLLAQVGLNPVLSTSAGWFPGENNCPIIACSNAGACLSRVQPTGQCNPQKRGMGYSRICLLWGNRTYVLLLMLFRVPWVLLLLSGSPVCSCCCCSGSLGCSFCCGSS